MSQKKHSYALELTAILVSGLGMMLYLFLGHAMLLMKQLAA